MSKSKAPYGPLHADAPDHPKVYELAGILEIEHFAAFGLVSMLWARALTRAPSGKIHHRNQLRDLCGWRGDPGVLLAALVGAGFLDERTDGIWIHDWEHHGGASIAHRERLVQNFKGRVGARAAIAAATAAPTAAAIGTATAAAVAAPVAAAIASRSRSRSSSDPDPDPDARARVAKAVPDFGRSRGVIGLAELELRPADPAALLAQLRETRKEFDPATRQLDGKNGRATPLEVLELTWPHFLKHYADRGREHAMRRAWKYLRDEVQKCAGGFARDARMPDQGGGAGLGAPDPAIVELRRAHEAERQSAQLPPFDQMRADHAALVRAKKDPGPFDAWLRKRWELAPRLEQPDGEAPAFGSMVREAAKQIRATSDTS